MTVPVRYLQSLQLHGFRGHRLYDRAGEVTTLEFRRVWIGLVDVVLIYGEDDAEAYRGDDRIANEDPFAIAWRPEITASAFGTVAQVVPKVLSWPVARGWTPPPLRADGQTPMTTRAQPPGTRS